MKARGGREGSRRLGDRCFSAEINTRTAYEMIDLIVSEPPPYRSRDTSTRRTESAEYELRRGLGETRYTREAGYRGMN